MNFFNSYCFAVSHISYQWLHSDTLYNWYHIFLNGCIPQKTRVVHTRLNSFVSINATFNNILVRSCSSVLLLDETRVHAVNHIQTLLHNRVHPTTCFITLLYLLVVARYCLQTYMWIQVPYNTLNIDASWKPIMHVDINLAKIFVYRRTVNVTLILSKCYFKYEYYNVFLIAVYIIFIVSETDRQSIVKHNTWLSIDISWIEKQNKQINNIISD